MCEFSICVPFLSHEADQRSGVSVEAEGALFVRGGVVEAIIGGVGGEVSVVIVGIYRHDFMGVVEEGNLGRCYTARHSDDAESSGCAAMFRGAHPGDGVSHMEQFVR